MASEVIYKIATNLNSDWEGILKLLSRESVIEIISFTVSTDGLSSTMLYTTTAIEPKPGE